MFSEVMICLDWIEATLRMGTLHCPTLCYSDSKIVATGNLFAHFSTFAVIASRPGLVGGSDIEVCFQYNTNIGRRVAGLGWQFEEQWQQHGSTEVLVVNILFSPVLSGVFFFFFR